jgi:imidazolonepropionase
MRAIRTIDGGAAVIREGRFAWVGRESELPFELSREVEHDLDGLLGTMIPGFVDAHTHLPFAGARESEFNRRLMGETYVDIARAGGGIASTVRSTREASKHRLRELVLARARTMAEYGTTTAEAKSGYGLNLVDEIKQLEAIRDAVPDSPVRLVPTCLAAHEFPPENPRDDVSKERFVEQVIAEIMPAAANASLAEFCDVFVEQGVFTIEQGRRVLEAGSRLGMIPRIHADELSDTGGAALAAELGCASADHLMCISDEGIAALAASDTVANLLPGTSFFLMSDVYAPGRTLIDRGAIVALSTDCNPGSSMTESMQIVMQLAVLKMKLTVEEALTAATLKSAFSLCRSEEIGSIEPGKCADFAILRAPNVHHLVYHYGVNLVDSTWVDGRRVFGRSGSL